MSGEKLLLEALKRIAADTEEVYTYDVASRAIAEYNTNTPIAYIKGGNADDSSRR